MPLALVRGRALCRDRRPREPYTARVTSDPPASATPSNAPSLVRLQLDALEEFARAAAAVPAPGRGGALGRLNSGGWIVGHIAAQQDRFWNVLTQGLEPDPWLVESGYTRGNEGDTPSYTEAMAALGRVTDRCAGYLGSLTESDLERSIQLSSRSGREQTVGALLARSVGHLFAHAGELSAVASLVGAEDLGLPGAMRHSGR